MPLPPRLTSRACAPAAALILSAVGLGCVKASQNEACRPSDSAHCVVEEVGVIGNRRLSSSDIEEQIATAETSHLLGGALQNVPVLSVLDVASVEYERFDRFVFGQDLKRVERTTGAGASSKRALELGAPCADPTAACAWRSSLMRAGP